jgi:hypothetical protein
MQMTTPLPFDLFSSELFPGETVQWTGRPNAAVIFHTEDWALIPFSLLWGRFAIFWLLGASGIGDFWTNRPDKTFQWFGVIWGTPFVLMGQYMIWGRFVYNHWKKQRTYYGLTTRRALIVVNGFRGRTASSAYFENMTIIDKRVRHDGIGSISFGGPVSGEWKWGRNNPPGRQLLMTSTVLIRCIRLLLGCASRLKSRERRPRRVGHLDRDSLHPNNLSSFRSSLRPA